MDALFELLRGLLPPNAADSVGTFVSALLTFMVFTYIFGDNLFWRLAQHVLIGVVAAYSVVVAVHTVIIGRLLMPLVPLAFGRDDIVSDWSLLAPLGLGLLLWTKARPGRIWLGNIAVGFLLGVGAGLALSGALLGTLMPQLSRTAGSLFTGVRFDMSPAEQFGAVASNVVLVAGTLGALLAFHYVRGGHSALARARDAVLLTWGSLGRGFIWITFGALFAGVTLSRVTLFVERVRFLLDAVKIPIR
jgi:hypothetical protein